MNDRPTNDGMGAGADARSADDHRHDDGDDHDHGALGGMPAGADESAAPPIAPSGAEPAMAPAAAAASPQADAMRKRWEVMGPNQRITVAGGVAILVAYLAGILLEQWTIGLSSIILLAATVVTIVVVLVGTSSAMGMSRTAILRIDAGVVGAYSIYDLGDLISGLTFWSTLDLVLTGLAVVGAGLLVFGVWRMTGGNIVSDALSALTGRGRELPARLVSIGSSVLIGVWLFLAIFNYSFRNEIAVAVLAAVLALTVLWLAGSGAAEMKLPVAANLALAVLGVVAAALTLLWFVGLLDELDGVEAIDWPFLLAFLASAAAMAAGGLLGVSSRSTDAGD